MFTANINEDMEGLDVQVEIGEVSSLFSLESASEVRRPGIFSLDLTSLVTKKTLLVLSCTQYPLVPSG